MFPSSNGGMIVMKQFTGYMHGVNLGGWFSQCDHTEDRYDHFITEEDFKEFSTWNLDHVRVPVDYNLVETNDGVYIEKGFERLAECIRLCRKYGLNMILDLHKTYGFSFDKGERENGFFEDEALQERFYRLWEQFAERFAKDKDMLAFELLNEVTDQSLSLIWNEIAEKCIIRIRAIDKDVKILVGSYWNNAVHAVKDLRKPHDENVIYNFHCYEPIMFTHQGAYWIDNMPHDYRCGFGGTIQENIDRTVALLPDNAHVFELCEDKTQQIGADFFIKVFKEAVDKAEAEGTTLYCGEYGVIEHADREETIKWYKAIHEALDYYGIGRAAWSYKKMDFSLNERNMKVVFGA